MSTAMTPTDSIVRPETSVIGEVVRLGERLDPGTYVCHRNGLLLRVPEDDPDAGRFAPRSDPDAEPWLVTRISADPHLPRFEAKSLAVRLGLSANF